MNGTDERARDVLTEQRLAVLDRLQALSTLEATLQDRLYALNEQRTVVHEERLSVTTGHRADDAEPRSWTRQALEQEGALLREENALARVFLRLLDEQRRLRRERRTLLIQQVRLLKVAEEQVTGNACP